MKKLFLGIVAITFVVAAFLGTIASPVHAANGTSGGYEDNTPPFTLEGNYEHISAEKFTQGTVQVGDRYFPIWGDHPGDMEYHYDVLSVSGLNGRLTTVKFIFKQWYFGWDGAIYRWSGTKWVKVPTTMELGVEDGGTFATAQVSDGYYALLVYYSGVEKPR